MLKRADLPAGGWKATPDTSSDSRLRCAGFEPDLSDLTETGDADSPDFDSATGFISSSASVYATEAQARAAWNRVVKPGLLGCMETVLKKSGSSSGAKVTILSRGALAFPALAERSRAYRLLARFEDAGNSAKAWFDLVLGHASRVDAVVVFAGIGKPVAAAEERRLARLMADRIP